MWVLRNHQFRTPDLHRAYPYITGEKRSLPTALSNREPSPRNTHSILVHGKASVSAELGGGLTSLYSGLLCHPAATLLCQACHSGSQHLALSLGEMTGEGPGRPAVAKYGAGLRHTSLIT